MLRLYSAASTAKPFSAPLFLERCQGQVFLRRQRTTQNLNWI